jgi:hypothetical protein
VRRLQDTRGVHFELTRHFLARMFDGEWSNLPAQWQSVAVGLVAMALPAGMLMLREGSPMPEYAGRYRLLGALPSPERFLATSLADELALLVILAAVTGLVALLEWQALFPGRRDYLALAGLPIRSREIFAARFLSVLLFSTGLVTAVNLLPSLMAPFEFAGRWQKNPSFWANLWAQAAASGLECFFVFFAIVAMQGLLLNLLPRGWFARVAVWVQGIFFAVFLLAALRSWSIKNWGVAEIARLPELAAWAPPVWFAGLHEVLLGDRNPMYRALAEQALTAMAAAFGLAVAMYLLSYRRYRTLIVEGSMEAAPGRRRTWSLPDLLARDPRQLGILHFMAKTMARSRAHRMIWLAYAGGAAAILVNSSLMDSALWGRKGGLHKALEFLVLFWPLACSAVLLPGMRHVLRIPAELNANWIFRLHESEGRVQWMRAVERFVAAYAIAPIYLLLLPVALYTLPWQEAARLMALQVVASLTMFELLFYSWQQLPFTCSYVPGKKSPVMIVTAYVASLGVAIPIVAVMAAAGSEYAGLFGFFGTLFLAAWWKARSLRREGWGEAKLMWEDTSAGITDLGIHEMSYRDAVTQRTPW